MIGRVVIICDTKQENGDGAVHGVILEGWIVDSLEPRYLVAVLEDGDMDSANPRKKSVDGCEAFRVGQLLNLSHRDVMMAPAPEEAKEAIARQHGNGKSRRVFRDGAWVTP